MSWGSVRESRQELVAFARYENVNTRAAVVAGAADDALHLVEAGLTYRPHRQVALKADVVVPVGARKEPAALPGMPVPPEPEHAPPDEARIGLGLGFMF